MRMNRILVVAAHPDDDVLGCGATIRKLVIEGWAVRVIFLGEGTTCRFPEEEIDSEDARAEILHRRNCAIDALGVLGVQDFHLYELPCGRFDTVPILHLARLVEKEIEYFCPDTIFTHFENDTNNDHRLAFQATLQATRPGALNRVANLLSFEVASSTEWRFVDCFQPNFFVDVENEIEWKIQALAKYDTEQRPFPFPRSPEGLRAQSMVRGMQAGLRAAEAFSIVRSIRA